MDVTARTLLLWEHACCGDRYWSAAQRCDRCGTVGWGYRPRTTLSEAMTQTHFHARPNVSLAPALRTPSAGPAVVPAPEPAARPAPRRPIRYEDDEAPAVAGAASGPPSDPGTAFLTGAFLAGGLVFVMTCLALLV